MLDVNVPGASQAAPQTFFTADLHLHHRNILKYCRRVAFMTPEDWQAWSANPEDRSVRMSDESVDRMNAGLVRNITARVGPNDRLVVIGDLCFANKATQLRERVQAFLAAIPTREVYLVWGNHDADVPRIGQAEADHEDVQQREDRRAAVRDLFAGCYDQVMVHCENGIKVWCVHYPHLTWPDKNRRGMPGEAAPRRTVAVHAYGHVHGRYNQEVPVADPEGWAAIDVGVDVWNYQIFSAGELWAMLEHRARRATEELD